MTSQPAASGGPHVLVLTVDPFGEEVADRLAATARTTVHDVSHGTHQSLWPAADLIVLSGAREQPRIAEAIDAASFIRARPWFAISWHGNEIHVGPVVRPGRTACYRCFTRRRDQHTRPDALVRASDPPPAAPTGHARHHVAIAAGLAAQAVREALAADPTVPGDARAASDLGARVRVFNQVSGALANVPVVAVDGCQRCGTRFEPPAVRRSALWGRLEQALGPASSASSASSAVPAVPAVAS